MKAGKKRLLASFGISIGLISGGIAAYFLAPRKGRDTQKILIKKANKITQKSINKLDETLFYLEELLNE